MFHSAPTGARSAPVSAATAGHAAAKVYAARPVLNETSPIPECSTNCQLGVAGPSDSGKTYFFQSLAFQLETPSRYGVLARYLRKNSARLYECSEPNKNKGHFWSLREFNERYKNWIELEPTPPQTAYWYHLLFSARAGLVGHKTVKITFVDVAGEEYQKDFDLSNPDPTTPHGFRARLWTTYERARVMVFCLPLWVAFPSAALSAKNARRNWKHRETLWAGFTKVLSNYQKLRDGFSQNGEKTHRTRIVLALTQADDILCGTPDLRKKWIDQYVNHSHAVQARLAKVSGPSRYLASARAASDYVRDEFGRADQDIRSLPDDLEIDGEKPWFIPITTMDGATLETVSAGGTQHSEPPVPAHVDLPLLLALCDADNILM
jgi:hypothetical protein